MRLFTAVEIESSARAQMAAEQQRLAGTFSQDERPRFVDPELLHVTLVFIGEVERTRVAEVVEAMADIEYPSFDIVFADVGVFPPSGAPRVLTLGVREGARLLSGLHDVVAKRLEAIGVARETRPYRPHITLARWRRTDHLKGAARVAVRLRGTGAAEIARVSVTAVTLFESRLSSQGAGGRGRYHALARATLTCP